jgi:hypothetical protein
MKIKLLITFFILLSAEFGFAQSKLSGDVMFSGGIAKSDLYNKVFDLGLSTSDSKLIPQSQKSAYFLDFNATYFFKADKWKLKPVLGFGYTPVGFDESGVTLNDSQKLVSYFLPVKLDFITAFVGASYTVISKKEFKIKVIQTFNPMVHVNKPVSTVKKFGLSTRTSVVIDFKLKGGGVIVVSPFFQTAITKFNRNKINSESPDYYPYKYGITVGTYFKH